MKLCDTHQIPNQGALAIDVGNRFNGYNIMVLRQGLNVVAYVNSCPHTGAPLDYPEGQFFSPDGEYIQCKIHGALFTKDNGYCVMGPCPGQSLRAVSIDVVNGEVFLA